MAWRSGPPPSSELGCFDYDEKDPWTQRFICQTDDGGLSLDVNVRPDICIWDANVLGFVVSSSVVA